MKKTILIFITTLFLSFSLFSTTLKLKDGSTISGNVTNETEDSITISIVVPKSQILSNEYGTVAQPTQTFKKPIKRKPIVPGNFEITQGAAIISPIDTERLESAIKISLINHNYKILDEKPGVIIYMLYKNDWDLTMKFCYAEDEYWYEYVTSRNLGANPAKNRIHKNFPKWIRILEQDIARLY